MAISRELAGQKWVLLTTAQTPTNIAVIKYWGKRDEDLILPVNDSISVTLDPSHLCTITTVAVSPNFEKDRMWLNRKVSGNFGIIRPFLVLTQVNGPGDRLNVVVPEISLSGARYQNCLREIRSRANDVEDKEKGLR
ncbi:hypothetical protein Csa_018214 [Cucumis sativus]|nr:hypothetical protein Csa_018214 [Cucumis sativus]